MVSYMDSHETRRSYFNVIHDSIKLARIRNKLLYEKHGNIPEYALWISEAIKDEDIEKRKMWIEEFIKE